MVKDPSCVVHPDQFCVFEDIIDGYFPLATSLHHMMQRLGSAEAMIELSHAPIFEVPNLPIDAPVPLRVTKGSVGMIDHMQLRVWLDGEGVHLAGTGQWRWFDGSATPDRHDFDPNTRLAEPALVKGVTVPQDTAQCRVMSVEISDARRVTVYEPLQAVQEEALRQLFGGRDVQQMKVFERDEGISATDPSIARCEVSLPNDLLIWPAPDRVRS